MDPCWLLMQLAWPDAPRCTAGRPHQPQCSHRYGTTVQAHVQPTASDALFIASTCPWQGHPELNLRARMSYAADLALLSAPADFAPSAHQRAACASCNAVTLLSAMPGLFKEVASA